MIFDQESVAFQILDVLYLDQGAIRMDNSDRNFDALSYRIRADTEMESGGRRTILRDHSLCYVPSAVNYTRIARYDQMIVVHFKTFSYHAGSIEHFQPREPEKYQALFEAILRCWVEKGVSYKHEASALLSRIFAELYRDSRPVPRKPSRLDPAVAYVEQNCLKKEFSLNTAAEYALVSPTYFRKLWREEFGVGPKQYVIDRHLKYAASLIIAGYYTLGEIAELCGYSDYKHFSVEFRKHMGVSPSAYGYNYQDEVSTPPPNLLS